MTPLAHYIAGQLTLPTNKRTVVDHRLLSMVQDIHCFDVTQVEGLSRQLSDSYFDNKSINIKLLFLPAPRTWIELSAIEPGDAKRVAIFLTENDSRIFYDCVSWENDGDFRVTGSPGSFSKSGVIEGELEGRTKTLICATLALINHPKIIGRRQHMPHRGLERKLIRSLGAGKFPLHAWTEIQLKVTPTLDARQDPSVEAHYTGKRALHFCRAHLRLWNGELIFVSSHWRGDAALGIKQSRYKVVK